MHVSSEKGGQVSGILENTSEQLLILNQAIQRRIQNPVKNIRWSFLWTIVNAFQPLISFTNLLHLRYNRIRFWLCFAINMWDLSKMNMLE